MPRLRLLAATTLALALACSGLDTPPPIEVVTVEAVTSPPEGQVGAYLADCAAPMMVEDEMRGGMVSACSLLDFDQMCSPDPTGCWDKHSDCENRCVSPCPDCESSCATDCGTCKSSCGDDVACLLACAEARLSCQESCLASKGSCLTTCETEETACYTDFRVKRAELCPDCDEISDCLFRGTTEAGGCQAKFPADARCFDWCQSY